MKIIGHPDELKEGVRILMRIHRTKDGAVGNADRHATKIVSRNINEWDNCLTRLMEGIRPEERIYSTVDNRDLDKAVRRFKQLQLDNDYAGDPANFYMDIHNRWVSALQQPESRSTRKFLWDCDSKDQYTELEQILMDVPGIQYFYRYQTKNGGHIITAPFEYPKLLDPIWHPLLHKNAMMLVAYNAD